MEGKGLRQRILNFSLCTRPVWLISLHLRDMTASDVGKFNQICGRLSKVFRIDFQEVQRLISCFKESINHQNVIETARDQN